jgi:hypothetical protein
MHSLSVVVENGTTDDIRAARSARCRLGWKGDRHRNLLPGLTPTPA